MHRGRVGRDTEGPPEYGSRNLTPGRKARLDGVLSRRQPDLTVLAENLHKPRNFSAVIRTCDSVGINEVHVVPGEATPRRHWHTSQGAEKWVEVVSHESTAAACDRLGAAGFQLVAAHISDEAVHYGQIDFTRPTALVIGTELFGVSANALAHVDRQLKVPMMGMSQSLNVSVACAIVLYEALRQRQAAGMYGDSRLDDTTRHRLRFEWLHPKLAEFCLQRGLDYPALDEDGELLEDIPRS